MLEVVVICLLTERGTVKISGPRTEVCLGDGTVI